MRIFFYLLLLLLTSCTYIPDKEIEVEIIERHPYEEFFSVPYYLEYNYDNEIKKLYLSDGQKKVKIKVKRGDTTVIKATPFEVATPILGGCYRIGNDKVTLKEKEGKLAHALLEAFYYNHECIKVINYDALLTELVPSFDMISFIKEITEGRFKGFKALDKVKFNIVDLPSGYWYSANSDSINLNFTNTGEKQKYKMELYPGLYSYYNPERKMRFVIEVLEDGRIYSQMKN